MQKRQLSDTSLYTAPIIFGGNIFGWTVDEKRSFEILDAFTGSGFNAIDTADSYSRWAPGNKGGESETIIGKWLKQKGNRDQLIIATKVGSDMGNGVDLSPKHIIASVEDSLSRLQTDYIDLYQSHYDDPNTAPEESLATYDKLVKEGKVRYIGASNVTKERIETSLQISREKGFAAYKTLQPLYNLYDREIFETQYQDFCAANHISVIPYYSLASGFLTGKYRSEKDLSKSQRGGGIQKYLNEKGERILDALDKVSEAHNATPAQVAIAWLIAQPTIAAAIASATSTTQWEDLAKSVNIQLSESELSSLTESSR
jgi:aryl-alcohol dehydrogenase-like predicted oxidoreductase